MHFILILVLILVSSCSTDEIFGSKAAPPLQGKRLNVLHYDLTREQTANNIAITIPSQVSNPEWRASDVGQYIGLPANIRLGKQLNLFKESQLPLKLENNVNPSFLLAEGILYTYNKASLSAYNWKKVIWSTQALNKDDSTDVLAGSMLYHQGVIYLASGHHDLIAYDASNGKELWRYKSNDILRNIPYIYKNQIFVTSTDNKLYCLNLDGKLNWRHDGTPYSLMNNRMYIPTIAYADKIITTSSSGDLTILNLHDGQEVTQVNLSLTSIIGDGSLAKGPIASPMLDGNNLYILTSESELLKIDLKKPEMVWRHSFAGAKSFWIAGKVTYILTYDNHVLAVDNLHGQVIWIKELPKSSKTRSLVDFYGPVLASDQLILTAASGEFFILSPFDGNVTASYKNKFTLRQMPLIVNDSAIFIGNNGEMAIWK